MAGIRHQGDLADVVFLQQGVDLIRPIGRGVRHAFPLGSRHILPPRGRAGKTGAGWRPLWCGVQGLAPRQLPAGSGPARSVPAGADRFIPS
ncbi:hypothetical protein GCM10011504_47070 [Siccirubricoccus deserti]|nr:hypothetical protein GCM10011504_47070 [Siccirubricoccus deserti]